MSNATTIQPDSGSNEDDDITDTEWIVIVLVLVIVLVVLIITIYKCLEIGNHSEKSLLKDDQSVRSGRSTVRSAASSKSRAKSLKKMPLNAEITRFSAGRASRSAEYGVVIKDIGRLVHTDTMSGQAGQVPPHYQHSNTLTQQQEPRYVQQSVVSQEPRYVQQGSMMSQPNASVNVDRQYRTAGSMVPDSRAVFIAPEEPYYNGGGGGLVQAIPSQGTLPMQVVDMGQTYQVVGQGLQSQPVIIMQ